MKNDMNNGDHNLIDTVVGMANVKWWRRIIERKLKLGRVRQAQAGPDFRYFMVFKSREFGIDGAYTTDDFIGIMRDL